MAAFFLAISMFCIFPAAGTVPVHAAGEYVSIIHKVGTAETLTPIRYNFQISKPDIYFTVRTNERTGVKFTILDPLSGTQISDRYLPSTNPDWVYKKNTGIYENTCSMELAAGSYVLEIIFDSGVNFELSMDQLTDTASLVSPKMTLTKGFSRTIKVNGGIIKSCSSGNKKVVTVNNKGKVTAKKTGTAKITVKLTDGKKLTCTVTVKANKYTAKKLSISDVPYNTYGLKVYSASFDEKGNLVVKFTVANNSYGKLTRIPDLKITVRDSKKNVTADYKKKSFSISVNSYKSKSYTVKISKSGLKKDKNKIDLRTSVITVSGKDADAAL